MDVVSNITKPHTRATRAILPPEKKPDLGLPTMKKETFHSGNLFIFNKKKEVNSQTVNTSVKALNIIPTEILCTMVFGIMTNGAVLALTIPSVKELFIVVITKKIIHMEKELVIILFLIKFCFKK